MAGMFDWMKGGGGKGKTRRRTSGSRRSGGSGGGRRGATPKRDPANATEFIGGDDLPADEATPAPPPASGHTTPVAAPAAPPAAPPPAAPPPAPQMHGGTAPAPAHAPAADAAATQYHAVGPVEGGMVGLLIVKDGVARDEIYKVYDGESTIGRGEEARIRTDARDQAVSRVHAAIIHEAGNFGIKPLKEGTNPTFLNEDEVSGGAPLADGDVIRVGNTSMKFRVA